MDTTKAYVLAWIAAFSFLCGLPLPTVVLGEEAKESALTILLDQYVATLDPALIVNPSESEVVSQIYEPLYRWSWDSSKPRLQPLLAADLPTIHDNGEAKIPLQKGIRYQGEAPELVQCEDYIASWKRLAVLAPTSNAVFLMRRSLRGYEAFFQWAQKSQPKKIQQILDHALPEIHCKASGFLSLTLLSPRRETLGVLTLPSTSPLPLRLFLKESIIDALPENGIGTGSYYVTRFKPGKMIELDTFRERHIASFPLARKHPDLGRKLPLTQRLSFLYPRDDESREDLWDSGTIDLMSEEWGQTRKSDKDPIWAGSGKQFFFLGFNLQNAFLKSHPEIQKAIDQHLDRKRFQQEFGSGMDASFSSLREWIGESYPPKKPKAIQKIPHSKEFPALQLDLPFDSETGRKIGAFLAKSIESLGLRVEVTYLTPQKFLSRIQSGKVQLFFWGWMPEDPDPSTLLAQFLTHPPHGGRNFFGFEDTSYEKLFDRWMISRGKERKKNQVHLVSMLESAGIFVPIFADAKETRARSGIRNLLNGPWLIPQYQWVKKE